MSILQQIKKRAGKFIETQLLKTGQVLDVRTWETSGLIEIDLHLPAADMRDWNQVPYIKFQVNNFSFRDYTPFGWDAETATCSILIDSGHKGPGSHWAQSLQTGDTVHYLASDSTRQVPHATDFVVGLGDASSLGHLLALQHLTLPVSRFEGAVVLESPNAGLILTESFSVPFNTLSTYEELAGWLIKQSYCTVHTWFYLVGNQQMVVDLRRLLKSLGHTNIRVKGFWS
jgi:NADPH-dependent ferric siderophore reductase